MTRQIPYTLTCPYPDFETFSVTYNVWASTEDAEKLVDSIGDPATVDRSAVIIDMTGWPEAEYPGGPFGKKAPMLVAIWVLREGFAKAIAGYVNDPNLRTAS